MQPRGDICTGEARADLREVEQLNEDPAHRVAAAIEVRVVALSADRERGLLRSARDGRADNHDSRIVEMPTLGPTVVDERHVRKPGGEVLH